MPTAATPLPLNPFGSDPSSQPDLAYKKCCDLDSLASTDPALQRSSPPGMVAARLLGHLLVRSEMDVKYSRGKSPTHLTTQCSLIWRSSISLILSKFVCIAPSRRITRLQCSQSSVQADEHRPHLSTLRGHRLRTNVTPWRASKIRPP